jgi:hypothetical protein
MIMDYKSDSIPITVWPKWSAALYITGLLLPFIYMEIDAGLSLYKTIPPAIGIALLLFGPFLSFVSVGYTNCTSLMSVLWVLAIPMFLFILYLCF